MPKVNTQNGFYFNIQYWIFDIKFYIYRSYL